MTIEFSFKYYVNNYDNIEINNFNECFNHKIDLLPSYTISSKKIMKILNININDRNEKIIFQKVFDKYFKEKLLNLL